MSDWEKRSQRRRLLFTAGACCIALALYAGGAASQTSEVDSYDAAVTSQSKTEALRFIKTFASSHLVGDLIESLPPQVAREVCAELKGSGPAKARKACDALPKALVAQPAVPAPEPAPTAHDEMVDPLSPGADASAGVLPEGEPAGEQVADDIDNADGIEVFDPPMTEIPPAGGGTAGASASAGTGTAAGVSSGAQSAGMYGANDTVTSGDTDLMYSPVVEISPAAGSTEATPVSTVAGSGAGTPSDVEPTLGQTAGDADDAGGTDLFYGPVAEVAPAAGGTTANAASCSVAAPASTPSGGDTQSCGNNVNRDKSEGGKAVPPVAGTVSVVSTTAAISVTTSTSASTGIQPDPAPDTANSESSNPESSNPESSSTESSSAESSSAEKTMPKAAAARAAAARAAAIRAAATRAAAARAAAARAAAARAAAARAAAARAAAVRATAARAAAARAAAAMTRPATRKAAVPTTARARAKAKAIRLRATRAARARARAAVRARANRLGLSKALVNFGPATNK